MDMLMEWRYEENGSFMLCLEGNKLLSIHGKAVHIDGRSIDTKNGDLVEITHPPEGGKKYLFRAKNGLMISQHVGIERFGAAFAVCSLLEENGREVKTNCLYPAIVEAPDEKSPAFLRSLWTKMLAVPYDNTMWTRYEALPLKPGRTSYDVTVICNEETEEGLLIGATDFSVWKNAVVCAGSDARVLEARSGIADYGTHDFISHGAVSAVEVSSSPFVFMYGKDYKEVLEAYGDFIKRKYPPLQWGEGVPFGWNSWSGLAFSLNADNYREAGRFLKEELTAQGYENKGKTYVNLDAGWQVMSPEELMEAADALHRGGQLAGIYDAPFAFFGDDSEAEIPECKGHRFSEILLKDETGELLARVDGAIPMDVTHPLWEMRMRQRLSQFAAWGFDYVKLDFLSHGAMEGVHNRKECVTGRMAIARGYQLLTECLSFEKIGRPFFISLSIAPLFPSGFGHARRVSCDAFGLAEDVEYVLNAQTYAWWMNGRLYQYNDPDHISLYRSFGADRNSTAGESRARYQSAVIAGTVMMLSDDYGCKKEEEAEAKERARQIACNREINELARRGCSFRPMGLAGTSAASSYLLEEADSSYLAVFHWKKEKEAVEIRLPNAFLGAKSLKELWSGRQFAVENGTVSWNPEGCDAMLLKYEKEQ